MVLTLFQHRVRVRGRLPARSAFLRRNNITGPFS
jgi:hypothetical protein